MTSRIGPETRERILAAWPAILAEIAEGDLIQDVRARHGISAGELRAFRADPAREAEYQKAREDSADAFMDLAMRESQCGPRKLIATDGTPVLDDAGKPVVVAGDAAVARVRVDTLKWAARIRNPRLYGDKQQLDVNVKTIDLTRTIQEANARLQAAQRPALRDVSDAELVVPLLASKPDLF